MHALDPRGPLLEKATTTVAKSRGNLPKNGWKFHPNFRRDKVRIPSGEGSRVTDSQHVSPSHQTLGAHAFRVADRSERFDYPSPMQADHHPAHAHTPYPTPPPSRGGALGLAGPSVG